MPAKVKFVRGTVLDQSLLSRLFADFRFEYVFHLATYAAEGLSHFIRNLFFLGWGSGGYPWVVGEIVNDTIVPMDESTVAGKWPNWRFENLPR